MTIKTVIKYLTISFVFLLATAQHPGACTEHDRVFDRFWKDKFYKESPGYVTLEEEKRRSSAKSKPTPSVSKPRYPRSNATAKAPSVPQSQSSEKNKVDYAARNQDILNSLLFSKSNTTPKSQTTAQQKNHANDLTEKPNVSLLHSSTKIEPAYSEPAAKDQELLDFLINNPMFYQNRPTTDTHNTQNQNAATLQPSLYSQKENYCNSNNSQPDKPTNLLPDSNCGMLYCGGPVKPEEEVGSSDTSRKSSTLANNDNKPDPDVTRIIEEIIKASVGSMWLLEHEKNQCTEGSQNQTLENADEIMQLLEGTV